MTQFCRAIATYKSTESESGEFIPDLSVQRRSLGASKPEGAGTGINLPAAVSNSDPSDDHDSSDESDDHDSSDQSLMTSVKYIWNLGSCYIACTGAI